MSNTLEKQVENKVVRNEKGQIIQGTANPYGRPKGKTMKEFAREFLLKMSDDEKVEWLKSLGKDIVWRMAEGNPHQTTDVTSGGKPLPLLGGLSKNGDSNNGNQEVAEIEEEN